MTNINKPFYKKVLTITIAGLIATTVVGCSNNKSKNSNNTQTTQKVNKTNSKKKSSKITSQKNALRKNYNKIKIGDVTNRADGGSTIKAVKKILGNPDSTTTTTVKAYKAKSYTWNKDGVVLNVEFENNKAFSKLISGFKWNRNGQALDKKAFNHTKIGSSYDSLVNKYGEPDGLHESLVLGNKSIIAIYFTNITGPTKSNAEFHFMNNKLTSKTQTELK
ncbi:DUF3862 domain-containing protein [Lactobacillus acetotolerans]|nr:DUF3862 domain-containing protein [Lactobacillus acetotolerans]QGV04408.1 DUF3862 domain-containing protein [Lactobacillus acetotolerans]